ncbi:hypothetical protein RRG08_062846 [Elysia crispata]|uniref:Uncharacterized protein n=1 Tax=Elysia crispata TaxID=231223 RepID=A0AAE1DCC4_9GAST|nr:hypothetical protein RRG08_062846 [Elysia crispata]
MRSLQGFTRSLEDGRAYGQAPHGRALYARSGPVKSLDTTYNTPQGRAYARSGQGISFSARPCGAFKVSHVVLKMAAYARSGQVKSLDTTYNTFFYLRRAAMRSLQSFTRSLEDGRAYARSGQVKSLDTTYNTRFFTLEKRFPLDLTSRKPGPLQDYV